MTEPIEILNELGLSLVKTSSTNNGEYHGPCPFCKEGKDRFIVTPNPPGSRFGLYYCRRCKKGGKIPGLAKFLGGDPSAIPLNNSPESTRYNFKLKETLKKVPPPEEWQKRLKWWVDYSANHVNTCEPFRRRNIKEETVKALSLGYNSKKRDLTIGNDNVLFHQGMVIPNFRDDTLYSVQVRGWPGNKGYHYCKGSTVVPYHITKLDTLEAPIIIVESALDAAVLYQDAGDLVHAVALGSAQAKPDAYLRALISKASQLFVCLDYDDAGIGAKDWWIDNYPNAEIGFCPRGKDIGEYHLSSGSVRDWVKQIINECSIPQRPEADIDLEVISGNDAFKALLQSMRQSEIIPAMSISGDILGLAVEGSAFAFDLKQVEPDALACIEDMTVIAYDGVKFIEVLGKMGIRCRKVESVLLQFLTMSGMIWDQEKLSQLRLGYSCSDYIDDSDDDDDTRAAMDAHTCLEIYRIQELKIQKKKLEKAYKLFADAQPAVAEIRTTGFYFDKEAHSQMIPAWQAEIDQLDPKEKRYGELHSRLSTWGEKFAGFCDSNTNRIYPNFQFNESPTARFSTTGSNLLNVPHEVRPAFLAPEGRILIGADYSQIDLKSGAMISGDKEMIKAFESGLDFHALTASVINKVGIQDVTSEQRDEAKELNYKVIYGDSSKQTAMAKIRMRKAFPHFYKWLDNQAKNYRKKPSVTMPSGRLVLGNNLSKGWGRQRCNYPIQGASSEVFLAALARLKPALDGLDAKIVLGIHDEIILEVTNQDAEAAGTALVAAMEQGFLEIFPQGPINGLVNLKQGRTWADIK